MNKRKWLVVISLIVLWTAFVRIYTKINQGSGGGLTAPALEAPLSIQKKSVGWNLLDASGKSFDWSTTANKMILINIWATWCPPCRAELPSLAELAKNAELKDKLTVLCISTDDAPAQLKSFLAKQNLDLPAYYAPVIPSEFVTPGIPATFLLSSDGTVLGSEMGAARWDDPQFIQRLITIYGKVSPHPQPAAAE